MIKLPIFGVWKTAKYFKVHRLVLEAFYGLSPLGVNHKDGNKANNSLGNLEYVSQGENNRHAYRIGLKDPSNRKLTKKDVIEIKNLIARGVMQKDVAERFRVRYQTIQKIRKGETWALIWPLIFLFSPLAVAHPIDMEAIAQIESGNNRKAVGDSGEIGLYQISQIVLKHFNQVHNGKPKKSPYDLKYKVDDEKHLTDGGEIDWKYIGDFEPEDLKHPMYNSEVANWYMNWLYDRCWTVKDTLIAWNMGIGRWRDWKTNTLNCEGYKLESGQCATRSIDNRLPKVTKEYLKKYVEITGEDLL